MKKFFFGVILLALVSGFPMMTMAAVNINIQISLPPPIVFTAPPDVVVLPDTNEVYVDPDIDVDLFFWDGWWWRLWEGRWYRARYYDRGWAYYSSVPIFYFDIDPGWRGYYREHNWYGHPWNYKRIPHRQLQQNWKNWYDNKHWERQGTWGVQGYHPRPQQQRQELRRQRQTQYEQSPEVQRHRAEEQQRQSQARKPQGQPQKKPQVNKPKPQEHQPQVQQPQRGPEQQRLKGGEEQRKGESQHQKPQGKPEEGDAEHRK